MARDVNQWRFVKAGWKPAPRKKNAYRCGVILLIDNYDSFTWNLVQRLGELDPSLDPDRDLMVVRNDKITPEEAEKIDGGRGPTHVIISPGPCSPKEAGVSSAMITRFAGRVPVLGVCLGHQCMGDAHGMTVARHVHPMHGKTSEIHHDGKGLYAGMSNPFTATRYHSLVVLAETVPKLEKGKDGWEVSSWVDEVEEEGERRTGLETGATRAGATRAGATRAGATRAGATSGGAVKAVFPRTRRVVMGLRRVWADARKAPMEGVQYHPESFLTVEGPRLLKNFLEMARA
jgi:anthranilate synthase/aminodeoxychorismate synthase-like glutamine amidotransferase